MTIATTSNKVIGQGNGATTNWPFGFLIPDQASLIVLYTDANGAITILTTAQYSVTGLGDSDGGAVTYPLSGSPIAVGTTLTIIRDVAYVQQSSIKNQGGFFPDVYESALDYLTMQTQQLSEALGRAIVVPITTDDINTELPTPIAGAALGWSADGTSLVNIVTLGGVGLPLAIAQGGTGQQTKATAAAALGIVSLTGAGGTANAQTANAPQNYGAFAANDLLEYTPAATNTGAATLTVTPAGGAALAARNVFYDGAALTGGELVSGVPTLLLDDGTRLHIVGYSRKIRGSQLGFSMTNGTIVATVAANALTVAVKTLAGADPSPADPVIVTFRNSNAATGDYTAMVLTAAVSVVVSSGSTLGTSNATLARIWIVGFNDAGTFRLGVVNCLSGLNVMALRDNILASSTAEGGAGAADSAQVIYTGIAVAAKPMRVLGYLEATEAAAGTWATAPSKIHLHTVGSWLPGDVVQLVRNDTGAVATGTTTVPNDDTIPQITEGDQYMTQAITPTSATNLLEVVAEGEYANSAAADNTMVQSIYQDATANALKSSGNNSTQNQHQRLHTKHVMLAGVVVSTTFKTRAGYGAAGTTTFNGVGGSRSYGGVLNSFMEVREIMT